MIYGLTHREWVLIWQLAVRKELMKQEIECFQEGGSEYIRLLCGYLFCLGDMTDIPLLEKAKYGISFDVGCMIDQEWIDSLKNAGVGDAFVNSKEVLIEKFVSYYQGFKADDEDEWEGSMFSGIFFDD